MAGAKIYKYELLQLLPFGGIPGGRSNATFDRHVPHSLRIRHVAVDPKSGKICLWAEVYPTNAYVNQTFWVVGTGTEWPPKTEWIGTVETHGYFWHVLMEV